MPFDQPFPRSFTLPSVRTHAPVLSGVYGLSNAAEWLYIGVADNLQEALLSHLGEIGSALMRKSPTGFVVEVCARSSRAARQNRLVQEYEPLMNRCPARWK
jgi:predicted GIY-YIG superfamily endonuclease